MGREVSESCVDSLLTEMVSTYSNRFYANKPDLAAHSIEAIGYQVGLQLSERGAVWFPRINRKREERDSNMVKKESLGTPWIGLAFGDHLEAIKFICKDFWSELFKKQIDNLKTNHRGTFVLQDTRFRWLSRMSIEPSENGDVPHNNPEAVTENKSTQVTRMHLNFPCGIIRGALSNLGIPCAVSADITNLPACSFVVRIKIGARVKIICKGSNDAHCTFQDIWWELEGNVKKLIMHLLCFGFESLALHHMNIIKKSLLLELM
ncbi:hypothetical protein F8388_017726 [Cannabis sativa]|uniref:Uncharacterized protein n=1 Tax=Cannabis sativa TaxID=3483 RepID=A0A7J6HJZ8_CANSA|nr:hypothetical protein F8388_017726 [Cannabis sativa]